MRRTMPLLWCAIGLAYQLSALAQAGDALPRPVKDVTEQPNPTSIEFVSFDFQQPSLYHAGAVDYGHIEGEPSAGIEYGVEASLDGQAAIASVLFEVVDQTGAIVQPIPMVYRSIGVPGDLEFVGMLTTPAQPFRVRVSGEDIYGRRFSQTSRRLFKPDLERPATIEIPPQVGSEVALLFERLIDEARYERYALAAGNPTGRIVLPRTKISNVAYTPFVSASGRPLGIRITFDAQFSQSGRYNPRLSILAEDRQASSGVGPELRSLKSTIQPLPRETYAPYKEAEEIPGLLAPRADFLFETGITYKFTSELVPQFVLLHRNSTIPCLVHEGFRYDKEAHQAFARMLVREAATYRVLIGGTAFEGRIENFYGEGTFYRSFLTEGLAECERTPAIER